MSEAHMPLLHIRLGSYIPPRNLAFLGKLAQLLPLEHAYRMRWIKSAFEIPIRLDLIIMAGLLLQLMLTYLIQLPSAP